VDYTPRRHIVTSREDFAMHLTKEEKDLGKENFYNVAGRPSRREFLISGLLAAGAGGAGLGAMYFGYEKIKDPVRIGIIGTGDEGSVLIGALNPEYVQVVAIADIRPYSRFRAFHGDYSSDNTLKVRPGLMAKYGWKTHEEALKHVKVYENDYKELLDNPDVEAVIIAVPLHLHHTMAIDAMKKGKHVLTEKLMGHDITKCKQMGRVSEETGKLLATGHQRHYSVLYANAVDTIKQKLIGDIHHIRAQWHRDNLPGKDSWSPALPPPVGTDMNSAESKEAYELVSKWQSWTKKLNEIKAKASAAEVELWQKRVAQLEAQIADQQVKATEYGYTDMTLQDGKGTNRSALEELIRWRLWNRTGGGLMAELGSHQLDASSIFISSQRDDGEKVLPLSVTAVGGRHTFPLDRDCDDHVYCTFEYPGVGYYEDYKSQKVADENKKIVVTYSSINGNGFGGYGEIVMGTEGTLILEKEAEVMLFKGSSTSTSVGVKESKGTAVLDTTASGDTAAVAKAALGGEISRGYTEEIEHWAWCIRHPDPKNLPRCTPKVAMADAIIALTSNIAMRQQRRIDFKPEWFDIHNDAAPEIDAAKATSTT
jgi:predicted dehydrogenase